MSHYHIRPTEEQQEKFLSLIAQGKTRQEAAEEVGGSSTQFRTFINGKSEASLAFAEKYVEALEEAGNAPSPFASRIRELEGVQLVHRILDETILRALDSERGRVGSSNRMLHNLALLKVEDFKPLLEARTRHIHEGQVGIYAMPQIDTSKWTLEQQEEFLRIDARRGELIALAQPETSSTRAELPAGNGDAEVVEDAQFEEVA